MKFVVFLLTAFTLLLGFNRCSSKSKEKKEFPNSEQLRTPEDEQAGFTVADGFEIELVASERNGVINPIDITFDDAGRLWTQTAAMYPLDPIADVQWTDLLRLMDDTETQKNHPRFKRVLDLYKGKTKGTDKILVISDLYGKESQAKVAVWADSLAIPMSILPYKNGVYVAQGSELFFLNDSNMDGKADQRIPLLSGFGFVDSHTMTHVLIRGPGDWIHFSHGALNKGEVTSFTSAAKLQLNYSKIGRFSLDARKIELVSSGLNNIWGFQLRGNGQWFGAEANDLGYSVVPMEPGTGFPGIGNDRLHLFQPWMPELHKFRVGGTGISGLAFADDVSGSFPGEWKNVAFLANPITSTINAVRIKRNPEGTVTAEHLPDFLTSKDKFFRPVNMEFGPDGCLYIADWYDKIISHNEVSRSDTNRDKSYGRIWRIRHKSQKANIIPNFYDVKTDDLVGYLKSPSLWMKRSAWHQITDRPAQETSKLVPELVSLAGDKTQDEQARIHALWSLEGIRHYDSVLMVGLLSTDQEDLRREAVRSLTSFSLGAAKASMLLKNLVDDKNPMVRSQTLRTIFDMRTADTTTIDILVRASRPELPGNEMGGSYERKFERFLALRAMEQYQAPLQKYFRCNTFPDRPKLHLLWATQALPENMKKKKFLALWSSAELSKLDESTFIMISKMLENKDIYKAVLPIFQNSSNAAELLQFALKYQQHVQSAELSALLKVPVQHALKSNAEFDKQLALDAIARLKISLPQGPITNLINENVSANTLKLALKAMEVKPDENKQYFVRVLQNENHLFDLRILALNSLCKADSKVALEILESWIGQMSSDQKTTVVDILSASAEGSRLLLSAYEKRLISRENFSVSSAERVYSANVEDKLAQVIVDEARKEADKERRERDTRYAKYLAAIKDETGDPAKGKVLFQSTCLQCHKVGDHGQNIAPALDGSSSRGNEALLTAILNPDAAMEAGYAVYRITKSDNSIVEGYLYNKDERGTTIAFTGGSKVFIEKANIKNEGFLGGRSFMPKGLIDGYTDDQIADLFAFIRTLK